MEKTRTSPASGPEADRSIQARPMVLVSAGLSLAIVIWFFGFVPRFGREDSLPLFSWLLSEWNGETGLEYGGFVPLMILGLIGYGFRDLRDAAGRSGQIGYPGLIVVFSGALVFVVSHQLCLPRTAAASLPFLLWGSCHYLWGWRAAKILFFPLLLYPLSLFLFLALNSVFLGRLPFRCCRARGAVQAVHPGGRIV